MQHYLFKDRTISKQ